MRMQQMIESDRRRRRLVRIQFSRRSGIYYVYLTLGDERVSSVVGSNYEDTAEAMAVRFSEYYGLDITRVDVP